MAVICLETLINIEIINTYSIFAVQKLRLYLVVT